MVDVFGLLVKGDIYVGVCARVCSVSEEIDVGKAVQH